MNKRIELRTNFAGWFGRIAHKHEASVAALKKQLSFLNPSEQDKISELKSKIRDEQKIAKDNREEQRRYLLAARVCGNEVFTIR